MFYISLFSIKGWTGCTLKTSFPVEHVAAAEKQLLTLTPALLAALSLIHDWKLNLLLHLLETALSKSFH